MTITKEDVIRFLRKMVGGDYHVDTDRFYLSPFGLASLMGYSIKDRSVKRVTTHNNRIVNQYCDDVIQSILGSYVDMKTLKIHAKGNNVSDVKDSIHHAFFECFGVDMNTASAFINRVQYNNLKFATA